MDYNNIPKGLKLTTQIPLDVKTYVADEDTLSYLGTSDNLAFTYHKGLKVFCLNERTTYEWREVQIGEENTGLVPLDFTYPNNIVTFGVTYSNKKYNFFKLEYVQGGIQNIGVGSENVYKGYNSSNSKHEFKGIKDSLSIDVSSDSTDVSLEVKEIAQNVGTGVPIYTSFDTLTKKHKFRSLKSDTLSVTGVGDDLLVEIPNLEANTIYVNNKYTGGSSNGSKTKPYKTVAEGVAGYIGTGSFNRANPEKAGYILYVERGTGYYTETNLNLTIKGLIFYLERDTTINITNGTNWLFDLDSGIGATFGYNHSSVFYIYGMINLYGNGFRSSGTDSTLIFNNTSNIELRGNGRIQLLLTPEEVVADGPTPVQRYTLISAGKVNPLNQNGQLTTFVITDLSLYSTSQRIIDLGGQVMQLNYVSIANSYDSDVILSDHKGILITGGSFRVLYGDIGGSGTLKRDALIHVEGNQTSIAHPYHQPSILIKNVLTSGKFKSFISYKHTAIPSYDFTGKISISNMTNYFIDTDALLCNKTSTINTLDIRDCILEGFPKLKDVTSTADIKIKATASNLIGAYIIDSLPEYGTYALALAASLPVGARFVNTNSSNGDKNTWKIQVV